MFIKECVFNKCVDRKSIKFQRSVLVNTPLSIKYNETLKALLPVCMKLLLLLRGRSREGAKPSGLLLKQALRGLGMQRSRST